MRLELENNLPVLYLDGKISSINAVEVEKNIIDALKNLDAEKNLVLDMRNVEYISSAGVRIILKLAKKFHRLKIRDASPEVYGVLDMTGLTKIISVTRALREVSLGGAEIIGKGYAGTVYRLSDDLILKLYNEGITRELVDKEKSHAEKAFLNGIPTAVSYDVVRRGNQFGIIFEMMNAKNLAQVFAAEPQNFDSIVRREAQFLRKLHKTPFASGALPKMKDNYKWHLNRTAEFLSPEEIQFLCSLVDEIPDRETFLHGDFHPKNIMVSNGEFILIDMTDVALGHPIFDLMCILFSCRYSTWGNPERLPEIIGFDAATAEKYLRLLFRFYFESADENFVAKATDLAEKLSWLRRLVVLPYLKDLPRSVTENIVEGARREFLPIAKNLLSDYRDILNAV